MVGIGHKIKRIREIKGLKQEFMANELNISQQSYSNIEAEKIDVPFSRIEQIAQIFNMKTEDLVSFDEKFVLNNYGEIKGNQYANIYNNLSSELKQLYEDKIKLLEDKISLMEQLFAKK